MTQTGCSRVANPRSTGPEGEPGRDRPGAHELAQRNTVVLGVSPDNAESHRRFADRFALPFALLADPDKQVLGAFSAFGTKVMYGRKVKGVTRSTVWIGPDGKVKKHWRKVTKAAERPAEVLAALDGDE
jgi:peroxiredoxin Q/BCP